MPTATFIVWALWAVSVPVAFDYMHNRAVGRWFWFVTHLAIVWPFALLIWAINQ